MRLCLPMSPHGAPPRRRAWEACPRAREGGIFPRAQPRLGAVTECSSCSRPAPRAPPRPNTRPLLLSFQTKPDPSRTAVLFATPSLPLEISLLLFALFSCFTSECFKPHHMGAGGGGWRLRQAAAEPAGSHRSRRLPPHLPNTTCLPSSQGVATVPAVSEQRGGGRRGRSAGWVCGAGDRRRCGRGLPSGHTHTSSACMRALTAPAHSCALLPATHTKQRCSQPQQINEKLAHRGRTGSRWCWGRRWPWTARRGRCA